MSRLTRAVRAGGSALILTLATTAAALPTAAADGRGGGGHVFVQTNDSAGNVVVAFERHDDGSLTHDETVATGGLGTSAGLGDQGALAITDDRRHLLVVNAGSDDVSLFKIQRDGLRLVDVQAVGDRPVSVDVHEDLVYVLNQGSDTIEALEIKHGDDLKSVPQSTRPLSTTNANAAEVAFSPDGRVLAVTEKATQTIDTYLVQPNGRADGPNAQPSSGATPFGFQFGPDGRLYVSEAPGSAASSYNIDQRGQLSVISASVPNNQAAACWLVVTSDGRFAYTANAGAANISHYTIGASGALSLVGDGASGATGPGPVDLDVTDGDEFLYVLNSRSGSISGFSVSPDDGSLTGLPGVSGLATGWAGLVAA